MKPNPSLQTENVAEYVLYIFQIEAMIRSLSFDLDQIDTQLITPSFKDSKQRQEQLDWYGQIIDEMQQRQLLKEGHLEIVDDVLVELVYLHNTLLTVLNDEKYKGLCEQAHEALQAFKLKSNMAHRHDVEVLFHAMFMKLQLKMKQQAINPETEAAMDLFRIQLAYLSQQYKRMRSGELNFIQN